MVEVVGWEPSQRTEVTLVDQTDLANGYTTIFPYNQILIFPVAPPMLWTVGDYDGWLKTVFAHEYAHVLGLDPVRGYSAVLRKIFGRVGIPATPFGALFWFFSAPPNVFLPPWFHEGLATNLETDLTGRGRKGSTLYRMIYRCDVAEGTIPPLDRLGGDFPDWPSYATRYIYGARLLQVVEERHGEKALGSLVRGHSGRFPYAIDQPPARLTGQTYQGLYRRMLTDLEREYRPEIEQLSREGLTRHETISSPGYSSWGPLWADSHTVVYTKDVGIKATLVRKNVADGTERRLAERPGSTARPTLRAGNVVYPRVEVYRPFAGERILTDLYSVGLDGGSAHRITQGARLLEADYDESTRSYAAVKLEDARHRLVVLRETTGGLLEDVLLDEVGVRYDTPRWSPDGNRIAFSRKTDTGRARLAVLNLATGQVDLLTPEGSEAGFPAWHPDGRSLAFAWDRSGVFDLYLWEEGVAVCRRLTRVLGGAFEPDWSPDGNRLAFTSYSAKGFEVSLLDTAHAMSDPVPVSPESLAAAPQVPPAPETPPGTVTGYAGTDRLWPTFWLPDAIEDNEGLAPGVWTAGHDPLLRHVYFAAGYWAVDSQRFFGQGIYRNDTTYPTLTARAWRLPVLYTDLFDVPGSDLDYWEETYGIGLEVRQNLPRLLRRWSVALEWAWEERDRLSLVGDDLRGRQDLADLPFEGTWNPLTLSARYDSSFPQRNAFTVGPEGGRWLEAGLRVTSEALGADLDTQALLGEWREYVGIPRLKHTVLALRGNGGVGWGDAPFQSLFQVGGVEGEFPVRGYDARVARGERAFAGSAELRFPLWSPFRGIRDWPVFLRRVHAAGFFDAGRAWRGDDDEWRKAAGAELRVDTLLGYYLPTTLAGGVAYGFDEDGGTRGYVTFRYLY